jgi:hypothetical protein
MLTDRGMSDRQGEGRGEALSAPNARSSIEPATSATRSAGAVDFEPIAPATASMSSHTFAPSRDSS